MGKIYSRDEMQQVAAMYVAIGNQNEVARQTGVPQTTISKWFRENDTFAECLELAQSQYSTELPGKLSALLDKAFEKLSEKLQGPVSEMQMNHLVTTLGVVFDKRQIALNRPTSISAKAEDIEARLQKNAETLRKAAERKAA